MVCSTCFSSPAPFVDLQRASSTTCAVLQGSIVERAQGFSYAVDDREGIIMEVLEKGLRFNKRTQSLLLMSYLQDYDLQVSS